MKKFFVPILILTIIFSGCYKYVEIDYDYALYNRLVGPDGGIIKFYANYSNDTAMYFWDTTSQILVQLDVPAGALDSEMVFNFYQFQDFDIASELSKGLAEVGSKFIYFVPVYASDGYHEHDDADLTYHLSIDFNKPIEVTYYYKADPKLVTIDEKKLQFEFYDWLNPNYKLYKIKIPEINEWGEERNIFVQWNQQGYPIGYYNNDLKDILLGYWYPYNPNNNASSSIINWQECSDYFINPTDQSVTFKIENTDYIYILARVIQISIDKLPIKIRTYIQNNFSTNIQKASIIDKTFQVVLEDRTIVYFDISSNFLYAEKFNIPTPILPQVIQNYLQNNYPNEIIQGNVVEYYEDYSIYKINLGISKSLLFLEDLTNIEFLGYLQFDYDFYSMPQSVIDYMNTNYPDATINSITNFSASDQQEINIYITNNSKNIRLLFGNSGQFSTAIYYGLKIQDITPEVITFLNENFPNINIVKITETANIDSNIYNIQLINQTDIEIYKTGELLSMSSFMLSQDLPELIKTTLQNTFNSSNIVFCYYLFNHGHEDYGIEFLEGLYVEIYPSGIIEYAGGTNFNDLKTNTKTYILANYSLNDFSNFDYYYNEYMPTPGYYYYVYLTNETTLIFDNSGEYVPYKNSTITTKHTKLWEQKHKNTTSGQIINK
ncbi:MAG: PepSY-like domain-containing protein [Bacteroidales bacterium]|nr:PepSY-like domain-containing protein [Bacteroidales bacterium]